jgi:hypothetical protein
MQKLSVKSMVMLRQSCTSTHKETKKIVLIFYDSSAVLYDFSKICPKHPKLIESNYTEVPGKLSFFTTMPSHLTRETLQDFNQGTEVPGGVG